MKGWIPPLGDELGHGRGAVQGKGDSLLGLAQPQDGVKPSVQQVVEVVLVLCCRTVRDIRCTSKNSAFASVVSHGIH